MTAFILSLMLGVMMMSPAVITADTGPVTFGSEYFATLIEKSRQRAEQEKREKADRMISMGSGFFVTNDGYFVTNNHVIEDAKHILLFLADGAQYEARVVATGVENDLAILKVEGTFVAMPIASSRTVKRGMAVATLGFPHPNIMGFEPKLTDGSISSLTGINGERKAFQISVPVHSGNSGGALFDMAGNVVGVVFAKLSPSYMCESTGDTVHAVGYAIKSDRLIDLLHDSGLADKLLTVNTFTRNLEGAAALAGRSIGLVVAGRSKLPAAAK